jgi:hypothetical protein
MPAKKENKSVIFHVDPVTINLSVVKGISDQELVELAKKEFQKMVKVEIPKHRTSIVNGTALSAEDIKPGRLILNEKGEKAIITAYKPGNKYPIHAVVQGHRNYQGTIGFYQKADPSTPVDDFIEGKQLKGMDEWYEGDTGYFVNSGEIIPVVFGKGTKTNYHAYIVGHDAKGEYFTLKAPSLSRVFPTRKEAEEKLKSLAKR